jgi:hypothetical protein
VILFRAVEKTTWGIHPMAAGAATIGSESNGKTIPSVRIRQFLQGRKG